MIISEPYTNSMKWRMKNGEKLSAAWVQLGNPNAAEILAQAGYDILVIDLEHAPIEPSGLVPILQAVQAYDVMPMVRAPWNDFVAIKRILDCGAAAIHVPYVNTKEEAIAAVKACKYQPEGIRGIAGSPRACGYTKNRFHYLQRSNNEVCIMLAIETPEGLCPVHASNYPLEEFHHYRTLKPEDTLLLFMNNMESMGREIDTALVGAYDGGKIVVVGTEIPEEILQVADLTAVVPETISELQPLVSMTIAHLFAYYVAQSKYDKNIGYPSEA